MASKFYLNSILSDEGITKFSPNLEPDKLNVFIPKDYRSEELPLWIFNVMPKKAK